MHKFFSFKIYTDVQELQHAVSAQQIASPHPYKKDYKEQIVGKGPHDPTIGYPEHDHHKKVGELASSVNCLLELIYLHIYISKIVMICEQFVLFCVYCKYQFECFGSKETPLQIFCLKMDTGCIFAFYSPY